MKKAILMILDGWGIGDGSSSDIISQADTPNYDNYLNQYPNSSLKCSGESVGLPKGQMGNSEVGHLNIGAGRIVYQDLVKINKAIEDESFYKNEQLLNAQIAAKTLHSFIIEEDQIPSIDLPNILTDFLKTPNPIYKNEYIDLFKNADEFIVNHCL